MFDDSIKFKYSWRPYQERTLNQVSKYIMDKKVHVVAAPGSGKTVLGLELARYLKNPVIIFAPTVTIKNQWVDRFVSLFTDFEEVPDWISTDVYELKFFNVVTYQALHYAYKRKNVKSEEDDETDDFINDESQNISKVEDIKEYDIVEELKKRNITTIVLDEAHHLKSQWWDSLKKVVEQIENANIIALTATPPYDSEAGEWKKYISLCGEIDAEIAVPELVRVNNLCPHQDYIFFNNPTAEERAKIEGYDEELKRILKELKNNENFVNAIKNHKYIKEPFKYETELLDNVSYYSSMLVFLNYKKARISKDNLNIIGASTKIPDLTNEWFEILLKNIILVDRKNYEEYEETISKLESDLKRLGVIEKGTFSFSNNKTLQKYLLNSIGKLNSISNIFKIESESLKENLRMVVLTDFIRKEYMHDSSLEVNKLGVFPIFIKLTKDYPNINMAVLTGSIFVIPKSKEEQLILLCEENGIDKEKIKYENLEINDNYSIVNIPDAIRNRVMSLISKLFAKGEINVIIGTKSLLGEGWDEPSINTLVLASFVGSFMLSNQMRGRAIRVNDNPRKTANIWHLVCATDISNSDVANADLEMLKRRFDAFVGIDQTGKTIENGISRMGNIVPPFNREKISILNSNMESMAVKRDAMYDSWKTSVDKFSKNAAMNNVIETQEEEKLAKAWFANPQKYFLIVVFIAILIIIILNYEKIPFIIKLLEVFLGMYLIPTIYKMIKFRKTENSLKAIARVTLDSLCRCKIIKTNRSKIKLHVEKNYDGRINCHITGATVKESNIFVESIEEIFSKVENSRYILAILSSNLKTIKEYYNVPELLAINKENAEIFSEYWSKKIGMHNLIYTRTAEGRQMLLKARMKTMSYKDKIMKKQVYSEFK